MSGSSRDPWALLGTRTTARIALGRAGVSLPTREVLSFALAHARARDAVHAKLDRAALAAELVTLGLTSVDIESRAADRAHFLRRPDLGRTLSETSRAALVAAARPCELAIMVGDGLSATAVARQVPALLAALLPLVTAMKLRVGPVAIAEHARVALGDEVGVLLGARIVAVLIGERPGLSAADSLGVYLTYAPRPGVTDAERNCLSNIRPEGLAPAAAARSLAWLIEAALARGLTGVGLKDDSDAVDLGDGATPGVVSRIVPAGSDPWV
ncbi:MAG: ethanolamine ammonia-lyase subunit EutC [Hyphomicrobiaceae bacterium]